MTTLTSAIFAFWTVVSVPSYHAIYISVLEFDQQQLRVKLFTDDLQDAIRNYSSDFKPGETNSFIQKNQRLVESYLNDKIQLSINGQVVKVNFQSSKVEGDSYWITFSLRNVGEWKSLSLRDTHFMELFPTQTNIIKITGDKQRFCKLTKQSNTCNFTF